MSFKQVSLRDFTDKGTGITERHFIYFGDTYSSLARFEDSSIDGAITSPPYWNQRDYGFEGQIGIEPTVEEYINKLTLTFSILRQKMSKKGVFFLNIGDKYISKYGNTPLGMIPFKLVQNLMKEGWYLQDTLIWYKPNHMPSSVKNRFTNTYEPVFVLVVNKENYYSPYLNSSSYSNYIKVPLQQNSFKHIATFPEILIHTLISTLILPESAVIVDPFSGSGTTALAIQKYNKDKGKQYTSISIEAKDDFVDIIKSRCNISSKFIKKIPFEKATKIENLSNKLSGKPLNINLFTKLPTIEYTSSTLIIKTIKEEDITAVYELIHNDDFVDFLDDNGIFILQLPLLNPETLVSLTHSNKWIIRNIIMRQEGNLCYPSLFLVKDIKSIHYKFNLDAIRKQHLHNNEGIFNGSEFLGYKVLKTQNLFKNVSEGMIDEIITLDKNNFPSFVNVYWNDTQHTIEEVINFYNTSEDLIFSCPFCKNNLHNYFQNRKDISCSFCKKKLWSDYNSIPDLYINSKAKPSLIDKINSLKADLGKNKIKQPETKNSKKYKGKFSLEDKINRGQSPGARLSVTEQYFFVTRYYDIKYGLFAKYLNLFLKDLQITKSELVKRFPPEYKHTIGHWFRYDMGGSLPKIEDIELLEKIVHKDLDKNYKELVTKIGIKLQSVLKDKQGKNPGDFITLTSEEYIDFFTKIVS